MQNVTLLATILPRHRRIRVSFSRKGRKDRKSFFADFANFARDKSATEITVRTKSNNAESAAEDGAWRGWRSAEAVVDELLAFVAELEGEEVGSLLERAEEQLVAGPDVLFEQLGLG